MYAIISGSLSIVRTDPATFGPHPVVVNTLYDGAMFGEVSHMATEEGFKVGRNASGMKVTLKYCRLFWTSRSSAKFSFAFGKNLERVVIKTFASHVLGLFIDTFTCFYLVWYSLIPTSCYLYPSLAPQWLPRSPLICSSWTPKTTTQYWTCLRIKVSSQAAIQMPLSIMSVSHTNSMLVTNAIVFVFLFWDSANKSDWRPQIEKEC